MQTAQRLLWAGISRISWNNRCWFFWRFACLLRLPRVFTSFVSSSLSVHLPDWTKWSALSPLQGGTWSVSRALWWATSPSPSTSPASFWAACTTPTTSPEPCTRGLRRLRTCHSPSAWTNHCSAVRNRLLFFTNGWFPLICHLFFTLTVQMWHFQASVSAPEVWKGRFYEISGNFEVCA